MVPAKEYGELINTVKNLVKRMDGSEKVVGNIVSSNQHQFKRMTMTEMRNEYSAFKSKIFTTNLTPEAVMQQEGSAEIEPVSSRLVNNYIVFLSLWNFLGRKGYFS